MSSASVRTQIFDFLAANTSEKVIDLTGQFQDLRAMLTENGVQPDAPWLGVDFTADSEDPVSLSADNTKGLYREVGSIDLHVVTMGRIGGGAEIVARGELLRNLFRGRRIGNIVVESVTPVNTGPGATAEFDAGYVSGVVALIYHADTILGSA